MVPHIARISSGSSVGAAGAERLGADEGGIDKCVPSELGLSLNKSLWYALRAATRRGVVDVREEWISPLRFLGVLSGVKAAMRFAIGVAGSLPGKKSRCGLACGGAFMSTSSVSDVGKSTLGGEDIVVVVRGSGSSEKDTHASRRVLSERLG